MLNWKFHFNNYLLFLFINFRKMFIGGLSWQTSPGKKISSNDLYKSKLLFNIILAQHQIYVIRTWWVLLGAFMSLRIQMPNNKCYVILFILNQVTFPFLQCIFIAEYNREVIEIYVQRNLGKANSQKSYTNFDSYQITSKLNKFSKGRMEIKECKLV